MMKMPLMDYCIEDPLDVLSDLCTSYPAESNCTDWKKMCDANPFLGYYCNRKYVSSTASANALAQLVQTFIVALGLTFVFARPHSK